MVDHLNHHYPNSKAAKDTEALYSLLKSIVPTDELREVWHDIEWHKSCDYSKEQADKAIQDYEDD